MQLSRSELIPFQSRTRVRLVPSKKPSAGTTPLCRGKKGQTAFGCGSHHSAHELVIHRRLRIRPICRRIECFFKELLQARGRSDNQELRVHVPGVLEAMHNSARELNHVTRRCNQSLIADLDGQRPLMEVEGFVFAIVNVSRITAARRNSRLGHKKFASGLLASQKYCDLIDRALVGSTGPSRYVPDLAVIR